MGFKITRPKNEQRNKMLPFFEFNIKISTYLGFCCAFGRISEVCLAVSAK